MTLPADFAGAHRRHWNDAELLFRRERLGNADHLYGFSAECGLKALMKGLGMKVKASGDPSAAKYRKHVQELWPEFKRFAKGRRAWRYLKRFPPGIPFSDWSQNDRYAAAGYASTGSVDQHRDAARVIRRMIQRGEQEGTA